LIIRIYGNKPYIYFWLGGYHRTYYRLDRRCRKRDEIVRRILRNLKIVDFVGWGVIEAEVSEEDFETLKLLANIDFRRVRGLNFDSPNLKNELRLYAIATSLARK